MPGYASVFFGTFLYILRRPLHIDFASFVMEKQNFATHASTEKRPKNGPKKFRLRSGYAGYANAGASDGVSELGVLHMRPPTGFDGRLG